MQGSVWEFCYSLSICLNLFWFRGSACFAYDKTVINQLRVEKSVFEDQSEEHSVWIIKWTTMLGIFCKIHFTPAVISFYHVHADAHPICGADMLLRCNWCRNLDAVKLHTAGVGNYFWCSGATLRRPHLPDGRAFLWEQKQDSVYSLSTNIYSKLELSDFKIFLNTSAGHWNAVSGHIWPESLYLPTLGILHWIVLTLPTLHTRNSSCFILLRLNPLSQRKLSIVISLSRMLCFGRVCASSCALNVSAALQGAYSCITLLWLHHNHKMSISYHKNGLISSHQTIWKWLYFYVLCNKNILKLVGYQQPTCLCVMTEFVIGSISLSRELRSLSKAAFVHVRPAQLCTENGISIYMCSAVDVVWLT